MRYVNTLLLALILAVLAWQVVGQRRALPGRFRAIRLSTNDIYVLDTSTGELHSMQAGAHQGVAHIDLVRNQIRVDEFKMTVDPKVSKSAGEPKK